ncbi:hypothetical protein PMI35_04197, partial [Pseudomonas sp. GM78]
TAGMDMYSVNKIPIGRQDAFAGKPGSYRFSYRLPGPVNAAVHHL